MIRGICLALILCLMGSAALAAPSISALEQECPVAIVMENEAMAQMLAGEALCTSRALTEQYDSVEAEVIQRAEQTFAETGTNGHTLVERIPSVAEVFNGVKRSGDADLSALRQLTYMQDFKFTSTGFRVVADEEEDQAFVATIEGGETMKAAVKEDFVVLQLNPESGELLELELQTYDAETGVYTVAFPCFGAYMVALRV